MDFFSAQDAARRKTGQLAVLFAAAVITLIVLTNLLIAFVALWLAPTSSVSLASYQTLEHIPWEIWAYITVGVVGVIGSATAYKYLTIRGGGQDVAESLGGTLLTHEAASNDLPAKRLLNVVEEMAIASGTPVPAVYVLPEPSINAFAAGFTLDDAVIGVNRGTLDALSRDELQGVIAHEFSHILNGDMRLNLRLIAVLHGILFLGMIGYGILRGGVRVRSRDRNGVGPILLIAVGLVVIGYGGTFFGKWIKSAVSRQREYLADGAAVQFTRNPQGISGALKKIGGSVYGSAIPHPNAEEASHLFFGDVVRRSLGGLFATHPPLDKRILAIEPNWNGQYEVADAQTSATVSDDRVSGFAGTTAIDPDNIIDRIGTTDAASLDHAQALLHGFGAELGHAVHDPYMARALIYAMLVQGDDVAPTQIAHIDQHAEPGVPEHVARLQALIDTRDELERIALVELSVPTLKALSKPQYKRFSEVTRNLIMADKKVSLFEWVLHHLLAKELRPHFETVRTPRVRYKTVTSAEQPISVVLTAVARAAHPSEDERLQALNQARAALGFAELSATSTVALTDLNSALSELRGLHPLQKPAVLKAATQLITHDLKPRTGALMHGIAAAMDCPLPLSAVWR